MKKIKNVSIIKNKQDSKNIFSNKKNTLIEKLSQHFSNKLKVLMIENRYPFINLKTDISKFFDSIDISKMEKYDHIIGQIESLLLAIIKNPHSNNQSKTDNLNNQIKTASITLDDLHKYNNNSEYNISDVINCGYSNQNNTVKIDYNNFNNNLSKGKSANQQNDIVNKSKEQTNDLPWAVNEKHDKLTNLKEKANDEWALIAKFNHLKLLEDQKFNKNVKEEKQKQFKEMLHSQLIEKNMLKKLKQEEDWQFFVKQNDKLQSIQEQEILKKKTKKDILKNEKEIQDKLVSGKLINTFYLL